MRLKALMKKIFLDASDFLGIASIIIGVSAWYFDVMTTIPGGKTYFLIGVVIFSILYGVVQQSILIHQRISNQLNSVSFLHLIKYVSFTLLGAVLGAWATLRCFDGESLIDYFGLSIFISTCAMCFVHACSYVVVYMKLRE